MSFVNHPAFQSLVLPFVLALAISALLRPLGLRWAALGAALGLVLALLFWPGFDWPATSRAQMLPWVALASTALAALAIALDDDVGEFLRRGQAPLGLHIELHVGAGPAARVCDRGVAGRAPGVVLKNPQPQA